MILVDADTDAIAVECFQCHYLLCAVWCFQMQSPEMQSLLNNPRALQAMMQIQAGIAQLQLEAPTFNPP